jgi:two-component system, NtrC family, sensor kinase
MASDQVNNGKQSAILAGLDRSVTDGSPMPMAELEPGTHIIRYVNPAFCLLASKTKEELIGSDFTELTASGENFLSLFRWVYRTGQIGTHTGSTHSASNPLYWSYAMWPVFAADHRTLGIAIQVIETTSFHQDATAMNQALLLGSVRQHELTEAAELLAAQLQSEIVARKSAEEALIRSEKLASVGRMAAVLAHEINNPLAAVMGIVYLMQNTDNLPASVAENLERADGELKRIAHITRQTLGFYREALHLTAFYVAPLLDSVLDLLKSRIQSRLAIVEKQCDAELQMMAMQGEVRQVISNLLLNSLDSIDSAGRVVLRASISTNPTDRSQRVRITVSDNGQGIGESVLSQIFEAFFTTKGAIGNGLGLWVSKQIVDKHRGFIQVRTATAGPQRGTTFSVILPMDATRPGRIGESPGSDRQIEDER